MEIDTEILIGKYAFISGATGGIGKAIAMNLAAHGCNLFLTSSTDSGLQEIVELCKKYNIDVGAHSGDLSKKDDIYEIIKHAKKHFGKIDILINSAGVFPYVSLLCNFSSHYSGGN